MDSQHLLYYEGVVVVPGRQQFHKYGLLLLCGLELEVVPFFSILVENKTRFDFCSWRMNVGDYNIGVCVKVWFYTTVNMLV